MIEDSDESVIEALQRSGEQTLAEILSASRRYTRAVTRFREVAEAISGLRG